MIINNREINHVAMYLRISQEKKGEDVETLENHRKIMTEWITKNKLTYVEFGEVISGGKTEMEDRPKLKLLLDSIEQFDAILVVELSRISRNGLISQTVKQYCIDYDKPILTPYDQVYDLANSDNDRLMFDVGSMISSHEHGVIGKRSKANKMQMAKAGLHVSGNVPFGYIRNPKTKKLEIDEDAAKTIRYIFDLHAKGMGSFKIRDILNEEGYKSATGKHFNLPSIKRIIRNPHYKGWTIFNDRKKIKKGGKFIYETMVTIEIKDTHPPIIPPEQWDEANRDRMERASSFKMVREKPAVKSGTTLLKDLLFCGICGRKMTIRKDSKSSMGYTIKKCEYLLHDGNKCTNCGVKLEFVEEDAVEELMQYKEKLITKVDELKQNNSTQLIKEQERKINQLQKQLKEVTIKQKDLIDLALSGLFTRDEISEKKQELISTKSLLESQIATLQQKINTPSKTSEIQKSEEIINIIENIQQMNPDAANPKLKTFIKQIKYTRDIPEDIVKLSTRNELRKFYPYQIEMEYY